MATPRKTLLDRDRSCIELLEDVTRAVGNRAVVIGGYAVTAWGRARFSVDLDLVLDTSAADECRKMLAARGLRQNPKKWDGGGIFAGQSERWTLGRDRSPPTIDLMIGGLHDRNTGVSFSFEELRNRSLVRDVRGFSMDRKASALVPSREALIGLMLLPFRLRDVLDIFALCSPPIDAPEVVVFLGNWSREAIRERAHRFVEHTREKGFKGSAKQDFEFLDDASYSKQLQRAEDFATDLDRAAR